MDVLYLQSEATAARVLEGMPDPPGYSGVRAQVARAPGAIGNGRASDALLAALKDSDTKVRRQAAWARSVAARYAVGAQPRI